MTKTNILTAVLLLLLLYAMKVCDSSSTTRTIRGTVETLIATEENVSIAYNQILQVDLQAGFRTEIEIKGALIKLQSDAGQIYILGVLPQCSHKGNLGIAMEKREDEMEASVQSFGPNFYLGLKEKRNGKDCFVKTIQSQTRIVEKGGQVPIADKPAYFVKGQIKDRKHLNEEMKNRGMLDFLNRLPANVQFMEVIELVNQYGT